LPGETPDKDLTFYLETPGLSTAVPPGDGLSRPWGR
jgi:hypothetical protein